MDNLTKKDILNSKYQWNEHPDTWYLQEPVESAMDDFAQHQSISFGLWLISEKYRPCDSIWGTWENELDIEKEYTTEELYSLFKESRK